MLDILIKNGQIVNGTGQEPFIGDVGIGGYRAPVHDLPPGLASSKG